MITWDAKAKRFRDSSGRFISIREVQIQLERGFLASQDAMEQLAKDFENGVITLAVWQILSAELIKSSLLIGAAIGVGGRKQMTAAHYGYLGSEVKKQYGYLNATAKNFSKGFKLSNAAKVRISKAGKAVNVEGLSASAARRAIRSAERAAKRSEMFAILKRRARLYTFPMRDLYYRGESEMMKAIGKTESKRIRSAAESCEDCIRWADKGWLPIDEQLPIGRSICGSFCRCRMEYR